MGDPNMVERQGNQISQELTLPGDDCFFVALLVSESSPQLLVKSGHLVHIVSSTNACSYALLYIFLSYILIILAA